MRAGPWSLLGLLPALLAGLWAAAAETPPDKRSGLDFVSPETRAMQADDMSNPGMLWVLEGEALWQTPAGTSGLACAGCHGEAESMRGVAVRYPAFSPPLGRPLDLQEQVNLCRESRQGAEPFVHESRPLLALTAYLGFQSRGLAVAPDEDPRLAPFAEQGRRLFEQPIGQLDLSCAACHDRHWGDRLAGSLIPQGHPTAYPLYRLEWQTLGSLQRRLRNCMIGVRAEPFPFGAPELVALELYLMRRAAGLPLETPGVRP